MREFFCQEMLIARAEKEAVSSMTAGDHFFPDA